MTVSDAVYQPLIVIVANIAWRRKSAYRASATCRYTLENSLAETWGNLGAAVVVECVIEAVLGLGRNHDLALDGRVDGVHDAYNKE